jgi:hypothetical protein
MNPADGQLHHPGLPLPSRAGPGWLAAGGLFLVLGFVINAAVITAWTDVTWVWAYILHQDPDMPVSTSLGVLALSPFLSPFFASYAGVLAGTVIMAVLIRVLGRLPLWSLLLVVPLCIFDFGRQYQFFLDPESSSLGNVPEMIVAQTLFGLACWALYRELANAPPSPQRAKLYRRALYLCGVLVVGTIAAVTAASVYVQWTPWHPEVSWSPATGMPKIAFANERYGKSPSTFVSWSPDGTKLLTLPSDYSGGLVVLDPAGQVKQERKIPGLPSPFSPYFASNGKEIILAGEIKTGVAFSVVDIASGRTVFQEPLLQPNEPGLGEAELTLSRDGSVLAAAHDHINGHPVLKRPISLYDTRTWQKLSTIELPVAPSEVGRLALSDDGGRLAFWSSGKYFVVDARTGQPITITALPVQGATFIALSPDSSMAAVAEADTSPPYFAAKAIRIFRLSDGAQVASRTAFSHGPYCAESRDDCGLNSPILWTPNGRFLIFPDDYHMIRLWNPFAGAGEDATIKTRYFERGLALSPDGVGLAISNGNFVSVFRIGD